MIKNKIYHIFVFSCIIFTLVTLDQISKNFLVNFFAQNPRNYAIHVASFLDLIPIWNTGISFGFFQKYVHANTIFLMINSLITFYFLKILFTKKLPTALLLSLSLIIAGTIGNLIDRLLKQAVFDFIWLHYNQYSFPVFNLADLFISLGATIAACHIVKSKLF